MVERIRPGCLGLLPSSERRQEERDLTKQEFVNEVANKSGLSSRDAARAVDAFLDSITDTLRGGGEVAFTGFGKFTTQRRAERQGVNPRNPTEKVTIPAATVPKIGRAHV